METFFPSETLRKFFPPLTFQVPTATWTLRGVEYLRVRQRVSGSSAGWTTCDPHVRREGAV